MNDAALKTVYQAVVMSTLLYDASAWHQRIDAFIRRGIRAEFCYENICLLCLVLSMSMLTMRFSSGL